MIAEDAEELTLKVPLWAILAFVLVTAFFLKEGSEEGNSLEYRAFKSFILLFYRSFAQKLVQSLVLFFYVIPPFAVRVLDTN